MAMVARAGDMTTGHGAFPPRSILDGVSTVLVEGKPCAVSGSTVPQHTDGQTTHGGSVIMGSGTVMASGKPVARAGDLVSCGETIMTSSGTVNCGG